jgi:hypothetical protein
MQGRIDSALQQASTHKHCGPFICIVFSVVRLIKQAKVWFSLYKSCARHADDPNQAKLRAFVACLCCVIG